jgi:hypothetical protein
MKPWKTDQMDVKFLPVPFAKVSSLATRMVILIPRVSRMTFEDVWLDQAAV